MSVLGVHEKQTKVHQVSVTGSVAECTCGFIDRWKEHWQAVAAAYEHGRQVKLAGLVIEYGEGCDQG
jgi:hypothetical protein